MAKEPGVEEGAPARGREDLTGGSHLEELRSEVGDGSGAGAVDDVVILAQHLCEAEVGELGGEADGLGGVAFE